MSNFPDKETEAYLLNRLKPKKSRTCTRCLRILVETDFYVRTYHPKARSICKDCFKLASKKDSENRYTSIKRNSALSIKSRTNHYVQVYGMPEEEALSFALDRSGVCEICMRFSNLVIDHNHATGDIRGKICSNCNTALGLVEDNSDTLTGMILYLERYSN